MFEAAPINPFSEREIAAKAGFSVEDYGKENGGPYQIVMPTYPAPQWLKKFAELGPALRECSTLCTLKGHPFRVVRWGREGSGAAGGVPCAACAKTTPNPARYPRSDFGCRSCSGSCASCRSSGQGPQPIAEFRPNGQRVVFDNAGVPQVVGRPNYVVSRNPFPRLYRPEVYPQRYLDSVRAAQALANGWNARAYVVQADKGSPVGYVDPALGNRIPTTVTPLTPQMFQELVAQGEGRSYEGQGA